MLGYGAALKMLLLPLELLPTSISRDEIVALINTLAKFSSAIHHVRSPAARCDLARPRAASAGPQPTRPLPPRGRCAR